MKKVIIALSFIASIATINATMQESELQDFNRIFFYGPGELIITQGETESVLVTVEDECLESIKCSVNYKTLLLENNDVEKKHASFAVTVKKISDIVISGKATIEIKELTTNAPLRISVFKNFYEEEHCFDSSIITANNYLYSSQNDLTEQAFSPENKKRPMSITWFKAIIVPIEEI